MSKYQDALNYLSYCEKNGFDVDYDGLTKAETIKLADEMQSRADAAYDAYKERDIDEN